MANKKLLQEAVQAFANGDEDIAQKKLRKYFVEQAQEINRQLEEEMEEEELSEAEDVDADTCDDEEQIDEDINMNPDSDLNQEIQYTLGEDEEHPEDEDKDHSEDEHPVEDAEERGADHEKDKLEDELPTGEQWASIKDAFAGLEKLLDGSDEEFEDEDLDFSADEGDEDFDLDIDADEDGEESFDDISFGEKQFGESFKMKQVSSPEKTEKSGVNKKSVVAKNAKSPIDGVKPVTIKDGTVDDTDDKFENKDALPVKTEDMNNVMDNGKHLMKPAKEPKNTADKSRSVVPSRAPKF